MNTHSRQTRTIDPTQGVLLGDNTPNDADRIEIGPTQLAFTEWKAANLQLPEIQAMRRFHWERLTQLIVDRCTSHSYEVAVKAMEDFARVNAGNGQTSEGDIWAVLHAENIRRGGEWIETRLLASGPRSNPWFQECGPRITQPNEIISFDTDLIGSYGICVDISRSWRIGDQSPMRI